jgi:MFS family permease
MTTSPVNTTSTRPRRELIAWRNAIFAVFVLSGLLLSSWTARIPGVRDSLHLDTAAIGFLILGMSAGAIIGLIAAPPLLARLGARHGIVLVLTIAAIGLAGIGVGSALGAVAIVALGLALAGFGNGAVDVMMNVEAATVEREAGRTLMPLMHAFFSGGTVAGAALGTLLTAVHVPVVWNLVGMAAVIVAGVLIAVRFIPARQDLGDPDPAETVKPPWRERLKQSLAVWGDWQLILIGVVMLGMAFTEGSANDWVTLAVVDGHDQSNATGAAIYSVFVIAMTIGRVAGGPLVDRIGRVAAVRLTAGVGAAGLLCFILGGELWIVIVGTVLWGIGASLGFPLGMSAAADDEKNAAARVSAVAMIGYCAFLVGPPVLGFLGQAFGILNALFLIVALIVLSFLAAPAVRPKRYDA